MKFSRPSELNDPFEVRPYLRTLGEEEDWSKEYHSITPGVIKEAIRRLPPELADQVSFAQVHDELSSEVDQTMSLIENVVARVTPDIAAELYNRFDRAIGILSLTESYTDLLMWSHYGHSHRGCVLEFDAHHKFFSRARSDVDEFYRLRQVHYSVDRPRIDLLRTNAVEIFLTKSDAWSYEKEWRMLVPLSSCADPSGLEAFPPEILRSVIFGANSPSDYRGKMLDLLHDNDFAHVNIRRAKLNELSYALDFEPLV
jgi:Protein of unknown function (DUF2971)